MIAAAIAGLTLAAISVLHCIGMCGPLALAMKSKFKNPSYWSILLYHFGRLISYVSLGILVYSFGNGLQMIIPSQIFTIAIGILLLLSLILKKQFNQLLSKTLFFKHISKLFTATSSPILLGVANGLLPCGLVYTALGLSLLFHSFAESIIFMMGFGLGTFPATMLIQGLSKQLKMQKYLTPNFSKYAMLTMALLLIIRGLNIGIPYLSPKIVQQENKTQLECCSPSIKNR